MSLHAIEATARAIWDSTPHLAFVHSDFGEYFQAHVQMRRQLIDESTRGSAEAEQAFAEVRALALSRMHLVRNPAAFADAAHVVERKGPRLVLWIYGGIGHEGIRAEAICTALDEHQDAAGLILRIASTGGYMDESLRIAEAVNRHPARSIAVIDRYAYSGGSVVASAANRVLIRKNASWMAHESWATYAGNADSLIREASNMRGNDQRMAGLYSRRRTIHPLDMYTLLKTGRHLSADEAVAAGVCDGVIPALPIDWDTPNETRTA